eukprot:3131828-Pyramimonas_sp.AAC.1
MERPGLIVSDHLSFVREANKWNPELETSSSLHAEVWRKIFHLCRHDQQRSEFVWVPSHKDIEKFIEA